MDKHQRDIINKNRSYLLDYLQLDVFSYALWFKERMIITSEEYDQFVGYQHVMLLRPRYYADLLLDLLMSKIGSWDALREFLEHHKMDASILPIQTKTKTTDAEDMASMDSCAEAVGSSPPAYQANLENAHNIPTASSLTVTSQGGSSLRLLRQIGSGAFGFVLEVVDENGYRSALKMVPVISDEHERAAGTSKQLYELKHVDTVMVMNAMTEDEMIECLANADVREILIKRLDVENVARILAKIQPTLRHTLAESSEISLETKVSRLLDNIVRMDGALKEFFDILEKEQPQLYEKITQCLADDKRLNIASSVFPVRAKYIPLDGLPFESTGCGTLVEILVDNQSVCGILAAFPVFCYRRQYDLIVVTLGSQDCDTFNFSFEAQNNQYIFACELLDCSFLLLNKEQIDYLESKKCKFLRVDRTTYKGHYEKSILAVTVRQNKIIKCATSDLAAAGCQLLFVAWIGLSAGSPVLEDHSPHPATVIALYSRASSYSYFNSTATQCSYIVAALERHMACSIAPPYPRGTGPGNTDSLVHSLREIHLCCASADGCSFLTDIKPYKKIHLLELFFGQDAEKIIEELDNMYWRSGLVSSLWRVIWRIPNDRSPEAFLQTMAARAIDGMRILLVRSTSIPALSLQQGFTQFTCLSPKNLANYMLSLIGNLIVHDEQQVDNLLVGHLNTISTCIKSHSNTNCESWMTADSSIWKLVSTLEQDLRALVCTNTSIDEPVLKLGILLLSVVVFFHKARLVVNCICHTHWRVKIIEHVELRRTHHHWFWRVKFEFHSHDHQEKVQDVIGPWNQESVEMDHDIWQDIYALLQKVSELTKSTQTFATEASRS